MSQLPIGFASYATGPNNSKIWVLDLAPDSNVNSGITADGAIWRKDGRWEPGDPAPLRQLWDYHEGASAAIHNPQRYRIWNMPDAHHASLIDDWQRVAARVATTGEPPWVARRAMGIAAALLIGAFALFGFTPKTDAAQVLLCAPRSIENAAGMQVNQPNLSQRYVTNQQGCLVANGVADTNIIRGLGWVEQGPRSLLFNTGVATGTTSFLIGQIPAGAYIQQIIYNNVTANSAGNISIGSTSGGADVVAAAACAANCLTRVTDALLLKAVFSASTPQQLFVTSSAWNSANLNITVVFGYF